LKFKSFDLNNEITFDNLFELIKLNKYIEEDIFLEASSKLNIKKNTGVYLTGLFKIPLNGRFRFYLYSMGLAIQIHLTTKENIKQKVIDYKYDFDKLNSNRNILISEWINIKENEINKLDIYYLTLSNINHFRIGMEIETKDENKNNYEKFPNMKMIKLELGEEKDLYEIQILTNGQNNTQIEIGCRDNINKIFINSQDTVEEFKRKIEILHTDLKDKLIIRKYVFNKDHIFIPIDKNTNYTEYSYSNKKSFEMFYSRIKNKDINKLDVINNTNTDIFGISFIFFIDKLKEERDYRFENNCYFIEYFSKFKNSFILRNIVSNTEYKSIEFNIYRENKILFSDQFHIKKWDFNIIDKEKYGFIEINNYNEFIVIIQYPNEVIIYLNKYFRYN
jgi:hypothetical protein